MKLAMGFAPLAKLKDRRLESLSVAELKEITTMVGLDKLKVTDELKTAGLALLQGKSLDTVSDLINSPESVAQLVTFLKGGMKSIASTEMEDHPDYEAVNRLTLTLY